MNHDAQAARYDRNVADESHPIRAGYAACLDWVAAQVVPGSAVLDLGSGTGNLAVRLPPCRLTCVDISAEMTRIARAKVRDATWVQADLLGYFEEPRGPFDAIVSTYAIHHLTDAEKLRLFGRIRAALAPGGVAALGDLMFESAAERDRLLAKYGADPSVEGAIRDEFFWDLASAVRALERLGFAVEARRFSDLSWGVAARTGGAVRPSLPGAEWCMTMPCPPARDPSAGVSPFPLGWRVGYAPSRRTVEQAQAASSWIWSRPASKPARPRRSDSSNLPTGWRGPKTRPNSRGSRGSWPA